MGGGKYYVIEQMVPYVNSQESRKWVLIMKIILKYVINNIKERKLRTLVMLISVVLSTTLLFVALCIGSSYEAAQEKMAKGMAGSAAISVSSIGEDSADLISLEDIPKLPDIQNKVGILKTIGLYNEDGYFENLDIIAADLDLLNIVNPPRLLKGENLSEFKGHSIILPEKFTTKYEIDVGDSVKVKIGDTIFDFRLADIAAYDTVFLRNTRGHNALIPLETLREILRVSGYSEILIEPSASSNIKQVMERLRDNLSMTEFNIELVYNENQIQIDARQKSMPFFLISFFALVMSIFIIFSSYKVITLERLPVIGTFRSIGATEKSVAKILMFESFLYGTLGSILGIPIGLITLKIMLNGLGNDLDQGIEIPMIIPSLSIVIVIFTAILVSCASAYIPIRRASKLPVKDVVLGKSENENISNYTKLILGAVLLIFSFIAPRLFDYSDSMLMLVGGVSLIGMIVATIIVIPLIVNGFSWIFEGINGFILGNEGKLATRNMRDNKNINQNVTLLVISLSSVIAISVVGSFVTTYVGDVFRGSTMSGFADADMSNELVEEIKNIDGIDDFLAIHVINNRISESGKTFGRFETVDDLKLYNDMFALSYKSEKEKKQAVERFSNNRTLLMSEECLKERNLKIGNIVTLTLNDVSYEYEIIGTFKSRATDTEAVINSKFAEGDFGISGYGLIAYSSRDPEAVMSQIRTIFGNQSNWSRTVEEFNQDALGVVGAFLKPMHNMTYLILLLAAVGIVNNLIINFIQKRRSIAMYKSVGLSNRQNVKMTLIEGAFSGIIGACIGIIISYLEIKNIFLVAGPKISMNPELDIQTFALAGIAGIFINLFGTVVPIVKSLKMKIVQEIKFE